MCNIKFKGFKILYSKNFQFRRKIISILKNWTIKTNTNSKNLQRISATLYRQSQRDPFAKSGRFQDRYPSFRTRNWCYGVWIVWFECGGNRHSGGCAKLKHWGTICPIPSGLVRGVMVGVGVCIPKLKHWVTIWIEPLVLVRGVMVSVGVYPKAKALGYYMGRTSGSCRWWESPVGMAYRVTMDFSP